MRLPPGYGQIVKLSGKRRRPFAVRVDAGMKETTPGHFVRKQKYLEYFAKRSEALDYLSKYNAGLFLPETPTASKMPTFTEVYEDFIKWYEKTHPEASESMIQWYRTAYTHTNRVRYQKFESIRADDLQGVMSDCSELSKSSSKAVRSLIRQMYKYALMMEIVDRDYSQFMRIESKDREALHRPFANDEIRRLWDAEAYPILVMIFTGMRVTEFLRIETDAIDLQSQTIRGGIKTDAGKNRIIPIHDAILPIIKDMIRGRYLYGVDNLTQYITFRDREWNPTMKRLGMDHRPHDTRHTCATLMERYNIPLYHQKLILGHAVPDITQGIYTHVEPSVLVDNINLIPSFK